MSDDRCAHLWPTNPGDSFTDRGYQRVELFARGGVDPMKSQLTIALGRKDTINKQQPAVPGANAGVTVGIGASSNPAVGSAVLSPAYAADLLNGLWYINIHSSSDPGGEIRGRVVVDHSVRELLNQDPDTGDRMGYSVSIDGNYAVVGTRLDDAGGQTNSGSVEIFRRITGGGWISHQTLLSLELSEQQNFGHAVGISGNFIVVGEEKNGMVGFRAGAAHLFQRSPITSQWEYTSTATYSAAKDFAGRSVAIDGNTFIAGVVNADSAGTDSGAASIIEFDSTGQFLDATTVGASDAAAGDNFGNAVSISGDYAVVGAFRDDDSAANSGSAYVFFRGAAGWSQIAKLVATDPVENDQFGYSVSIDDDSIAVGSRFADTTSGNQVGVVYVFVGVDVDMDGSLESWTQVQKLTALDALAGDRLGTSVAIEGGRLLAGASWAEKDSANDRSGKAYLFTVDEVTGVWSQETMLFDSETTTRDEFGVGVALTGRRAVVGSWLDNRNTNNSWAAYLFDLW